MARTMAALLLACALGYSSALRTGLGIGARRVSLVRVSAINEKGGFGDVPKPKRKEEAEPPSAAAPPAPAPKPATAPKAVDVEEDRTAAALRRAGVMPSEKYRDVSLPAPRPQAPAGPEPGPLSKVPMETQNQIEQVLIALAGTALVYFVLAGITVCADAYLTVTKTPVPDNLVPAMEFVTRSFSPSLGLVLLCSVSLGLFKQAQFSDGATGLAYREEED